MDLSTLTQRAERIRELYSEQNRLQGRPEWGATEYTQGLVADIGALMKLMMAKDGLRDVGDVDMKIRHELADCLWSLLIIANIQNIDIGQVFMDEMDILEKRVIAGSG